MSNNIEQRVDQLEKRVARLEHRESYVRDYHSPNRVKHAWASFVLDDDLNRQQIDGIAKVMEAAHKAHATGTPWPAVEFANNLRPHVPHNRDWWDFVKGVLITLTLCRGRRLVAGALLRCPRCGAPASVFPCG